MQYVLAGFVHSTGFRVFAFEGIAEDRVRTPYKVRADLALARKHRIPMQELPLLCRALLERREESDDRRVFTYTDGDMSLHANAVSAEAQFRKKKPSRGSIAVAIPGSASLPQPA